jgi:uncharacterized protein YndB with AHSA1/START domain
MTQNATMTSELIGDTGIRLKREFNAPRELVFEAHSDCKHLMQWWGPRDYPLSHCDIDFRPGGTWHYCMSGPNGEEAWGIMTFREIERPSRIVYRDAFSDAERSENPPFGLNTVTLEERGGGTLMTIVCEFETQEDRATVLETGMEEGLAETLDRLEEHLATLQ